MTRDMASNDAQIRKEELLSANLLDMPFTEVERIAQCFTAKDTGSDQLRLLVQASGALTDVGKLSSAEARTGRIVECVICVLGKSGKTLKDFLILLDRLRLEKPQLVLRRKFVPVAITTQTHVTSAPHQFPLRLSVVATGFPYPRFQWMRNELPIDHEISATSSQLTILGCVGCATGQYSCLVANSIEAVEPGGRAEWTTFYIKPGKQSESAVRSEAIAVGIELLLASSDVSISEALSASCAQCCESNVTEQPQSQSRSKLDSGELGQAQVVPERKYFATDKVALIICNAAYQSLPPLQAPMHDAATLAGGLIQLGFKTVTLSNLTLVEMQRAVNEYYELLGDGVYAMCYFVGHGLDVDGQSYLLPVDVPRDTYTASDCLCAQQVLFEMYNYNPALNVIFLDVCRHTNPQNIESFKSTAVTYLPRGNRNTVFGYATGFGAGAFEVRGETNGIFMKYLKRYIAKSIPVTTVIERVMRDVDSDAKASVVQFPELRHNLTVPRCLNDPIVSAGHTATFNLRSFRWQKMHCLPSPIHTSVPNTEPHLCIAISFDFYHYFSNMVYVFASVGDRRSQNDTDTATASGSSHDPHIAVLHFSEPIKIIEWCVITSEDTISTRFLISNLQKLEEPLVCEADVKRHDDSDVLISHVDRIVLGDVLISVLRLGELKESDS